MKERELYNKLNIKTNKIKCLNCLEIIESKSVHDYVSCKCGKVSVDGGLEYLKRIYPASMSPKKAFKELSTGW